MNTEKTIEHYNLINYLNIIDLSLLNLLDYLDLNEDNELNLVNDKLVLNFNDKVKKMLENFIIENINNNTYYNHVNILIDTCYPNENWHSKTKKSNKINQFKYILKDDSIYIDYIKMNNFFNYEFKKISDAKFTISENTINQKINLSLIKKVNFINFKSIDIYDAYSVISNILSNFGNVNKSSFKYNLIEDGNNEYFHGASFLDELFEDVRLTLINKGII